MDSEFYKLLLIPVSVCTTHTLNCCKAVFALTHDPQRKDRQIIAFIYVWDKLLLPNITEMSIKNKNHVLTKVYKKSR